MSWSETTVIHPSAWSDKTILDLAQMVGETSIQGEGTEKRLVLSPAFKAVADQAATQLAQFEVPCTVTLASTGATVTPVFERTETPEESHHRAERERDARALDRLGELLAERQIAEWAASVGLTSNEETA